jgi:hypothetical protein
MAGERKGITYEAIVKIALEELVRQGKLAGTVFWNEKPDAMTIEPDFTVGPDKDHPTQVLLVTHSGAAGNSHMKFWRNIGELAEAKCRLTKPARVYAIAFDSVIKEDLKELQEAAFDGQLLVGDTDYGRRLQRWVEANSPGLPKDGDEKVDAIRDAMKDRSRADNPKPLVDELLRDLGKLVNRGRTELDSLWTMERKRGPGRAPVARDTFLRRGVGKLLLLDHPDDVDSSGRFKKSVPADVVESLKTMGLAGNAIGGPRVTDPQMLWALRSLSPDALAGLHAARTIDRVSEWIDSLRTLAGVRDQLAYMTKHWSEITTGAGLYRHLIRCHRNPHALCPTAVAEGSKRVWLYHLLVEWVKLADGTRTEFGVAAFIATLTELRSTAAHQGEVKRILGRAPEWRSEETVRLGLQDWQSAHSGQKFTFKDDDLARVADALARKLRETKAPDPAADARRMTEALVQTVLEAKLLTYRNFKPFEMLLERELKKADLVGSLEVAVRACFADAASASGAKLDPRSSGTTVMRVKNTLVNWQAAHDSHTNDKRKELCGRAPALRYSWDAKKDRYVARPSTSKLILIVDGTWGQDDLDALARAGWDEIFYPDEMDLLVKAIL